MGKSATVHELPTGKFDAIRTLREALSRAETGEIKSVIIICTDGITGEDVPEGGMDLWATWSEMTREQVLWCQRWFNSWLNKRYFGDFHV